jgi:hypothetical protein
MECASFEWFAGLCAVLAGAAGLGYSIAFVMNLHEPSRGAQYATSLLLLAGGILSTAVFSSRPCSRGSS